MCMEKKAFENRLNRFAISGGMKEKYLRVFDQMVAARKMSDEEVQNRMHTISFAGHVTAKGRLLYRKCDIARSKADFRVLSITTDENLLRDVVVLATRSADDLQLKGKFKVYVQGDVFTPKLYLRDILAQIPAERLEGVTAISLKLDDMFPEYGYNLLADAYEYKIELFG